MPKMKTKSGAKKRFKVTATGKVMQPSRRQAPHGMIQRTAKKFIRNRRGTTVLFDDRRRQHQEDTSCQRLRRVHHSGGDRHVARQTRRHRPRQAQEGAEAGQGLLRPPQEHDPHRQGGGRPVRCNTPTGTARTASATSAALWIQRINAATREHGLTYGRFIDGLGKAGVEVDRKVLAELAVSEPAAFKALVEKAQGALA